MLDTALKAATAAGKLLRRNFGSALNVNLATHHDIKLELDEQAQAVITRMVLADFPDHCILGEEAVTGHEQADVRWVVDPLDGTVNYFYNIPHYAVSIAAQERRGAEWQTVAGVVYAPEVDEMFAAERGQPATLNGQVIRVSDGSVAKARDFSADYPDLSLNSAVVTFNSRGNSSSQTLTVSNPSKAKNITVDATGRVKLQ